MTSARDRTVTVDLSNERVVLATMMRSAEARARLSRDLRVEDFGDPKHQVAFRALLKMSRARLEWNEDTFFELTEGKDFGGFGYVRKVAAEYEPNRNLDFHVDRLRYDSARLDLLSKTLPDLAGALESDPSREKALFLAQRVVERLKRNVGAQGESGDALVEGYYETLRMRSAIGDVVETTGHRHLDSILTVRYAPGTFSVLVARPGVGKSTWVSDMVLRRARSKRGTYLCGWEMGRDDYLDAISASGTGIPSRRLFREPGAFSDEEKGRVMDIVELFRDVRLLKIESNPFPHLAKPQERWTSINERNLDHFEAMLERESPHYPLFVLDVIGKMFQKRDPDMITEALVRIRGMAQRYGVHIMALHHQNRAGADGPPTLEHIKGSGAFEEEADLVLGLDRPKQRASAGKRRKMERDTLDVYVLKQRRGPFPACVRFTFDGERSRISDEEVVDVAMMEGAGEGESYG